MAKQIIINQTIPNADQAWGGKNNTNETLTILGTPVPPDAEWALDFQKVEAYIKKEFGTKAGAIRWVNDGTFYSIQGFATPADKAAYISDPEGNASLLLFSEQLPISSTTADSYVARLYCAKDTSRSYAIKDGEDFIVPLRFSAVHIIAATSEQEKMDGNGTLIIERSTDGTNYTRVDTRSIVSSDTDYQGYTLNLNIGGHLLTGRTNYIRLRATFGYVDNNGETSTMASGNIILNISSVSLAVSLQTNWAQPVQASQLTALPLQFMIEGAVAKVLHVQVSGVDGYSGHDDTVSYTAAQEGSMTVLCQDGAGTKGILRTGVHTVRAWLTADDGDNGEITSNVITHQLMMINTNQPLTLMTPRLMIQGVASSIDNFVQGRVCKYAVYSPKVVDGAYTNQGDPVTFALLLTDRSDSILGGGHVEYFNQQVTASPGTQYDLNATLEIEQDAGEAVADDFDTFLHATRTAGGITSDFMLDSYGTGYMYVKVDNTGGFQPTAGSVFLLNPKTRNNSETNPKRILNARNNNAEVESVWSEGFKMDGTDGWTTDDDGNKVLRIPAGCLLNIRLNPFAQFVNSPDSTLTIDLDFCVRNVVNEDDPIIRLCETLDAERGTFMGLRMRPMVGTMASALSEGVETETDFRWSEGRRTHISINIVPNVAPNTYGDGLAVAEDQSRARGTLNLVRVFINGVINRELRFSTESGAREFCTAAMSNGGFYIGQEGADIDIYGIRIWDNTAQAIDPKASVQNWLSTLPTSAEKIRVKNANAITKTNGLVSLEACRDHGLRTMVWHGAEPYIKETSGSKGWIEMSCYDSNGNYLPENSGTICKATKSLKPKRQGTTANTYYYSNLQFKLGDVEDTIQVALADFHSSIHISEPFEEEGNTFVSIYGGNLGKDFPVGNATKNYPYADGYVTVPDGWVDGNGKYRGMGYMISPNQPLAQKLVLKINYASSMQSHLIGINWLYHELHTRFCGQNALQRDTPTALVAKHTEPLLFFTAGRDVEDPAAAVYRGPGAFGPGKMDKPTWGYSKNASKITTVGDAHYRPDGHDYFAMFEGANNNTILGDMVAPWDDAAHGNQEAKVYYDPDAEAFMYRKTTTREEVVDGQTTITETVTSEKCIDFDGGPTDKVTVGGEELEYPKERVTAIFRNAVNFLYLHNPRVNLYRGTLAQLQQETMTEYQLKEKWWCRSNAGTDQNDYKLKRWDFYERQWVDAGLWNGSSYDTIDIRDYVGMNWSGMTDAQKADHTAVNQKFISCVVADAKAHIGEYFKISSLKFHYVFENHFIAGTDNCSKNTYYVIDPVTKLIELHQDDVDTTLATDNNGFQSKPYYVDRMHPWDDKDTGHTDCCYEGRQNTLFNLCEEMWEETHELSQALNSVMSLMTQLTGGIGSAESDTMSGVWRTLNRYIFDIQRYFPQVAFNEAARIRYEFPAMLGFLGRDVIDPLAQSMGDQLESELQFMNRRLVYMASYAVFGEFLPSQSGARNGLTGLADSSASLAFNAKAQPDGVTTPTYTFKVKPHQYLYPCFGFQTDSKPTYTRVAPGEEYEFTVPGVVISDNGVSLFGLNYYRSVGNIGDMSCDPNIAFSLDGKRLTELIAEPTTYYPTPETLASNPSAIPVSVPTEGYQPSFRPASFRIATGTRLRKLSLKGCTTLSSSERAPLNLTPLTLCQEIDLRDTKIAALSVPRTASLQTLRLPSTMTSLLLDSQPNLATLSMQGGLALTSLIITGCPTLATQGLLRTIYDEREDAGAATPLSILRMDNIDWTDLKADILMWMANAVTAELYGRVVMLRANNDRWLSFSEVIQLIRKFGDIQAVPANNTVPADRLYIDYQKRDVNGVLIQGQKYIHTLGVHDIWSAAATNDVGNNIAVVNGREAVTWELITSGVSQYAEITDNVKGTVNVKHTYAHNEYMTFVLRLSVLLLNGTTLTYDKKVGFHRRFPKINDFAYADGSFDDEYDLSKEMVGAVVKVDKLSDTQYKFWVYAKENAVCKSDDNTYNTGSHVWGIYPEAAGTNGFPTSVTDDIKNRSGISNAVDTPMANIGSLGLSTSYIPTGGYTDASQPDGYAVKGSGVAVGDFDTEQKNQIVVNHAKAIINGYLGESYPTTPTELANQMQALVAAMTADGVTSPGRYRQLYYPATFACHVYQPAVNGELDEQYARTKWMLPACGLLSRIYNFYYNSCGRVTYASGGRCTAENANENPDSEALLPLFANLLKRIADAGAPGTPFTIPSNSNYWSVTECYSTGAWLVYFNEGYVGISNKFNSNGVRPVAAFTYNL